MKAYVIFVALLVLMSGVVYTRLQGRESLEVENKSVLSEDIEGVNDEVREDVSVKTDQDVSTYERKSTNTPSPTARPTEKEDLENFKYPNSEVVSLNSNNYFLRTVDAPDAVSDWYKEKIKAEKMNVKTFVTTKTNDNFLGKLVGAKNGLEVRVEVKRDSGETFTEISVSLDTSS